MDDDIVFMEDTVIPTIAHTKSSHPEYFLVSANIINQPALSWVHYHLGAVKPYLPELEPPAPRTDIPQESHIDWRASKLPDWSGPKDFKMDLTWKSPYRKHRWLPVKPESNKTIEDTPIISTNYAPFGPARTHWTIGAQQHYSFLDNLEKNEIYRYKFHTWDYANERMGIQLMAIMGDDINLVKPIIKDDETYFTEEIPKRLKRHAVLDGRAVAVHYSFFTQTNSMNTTDILDRYRSFAREHICTSPLT